jgi:hypothetical protein
MRSSIGPIVSVARIAVSTSVFAQRRRYTSRDVPRLADGEPDLTALAKHMK